MELILEFHSSMQHCAGSVAKSQLGGQQNPMGRVVQ